MVPLQSSLAIMASVTLDLDVTLLFQLGLVLLLMAVLRALVFGPYLANLDNRTARTDDARREAEALTEKADALAARYAEAISAARAEGLETRGALRTEGQTHKDTAVGQARADAQSTLESARERAASETSSARETLLGEVDDIARMVAEKVLGRSV